MKRTNISEEPSGFRARVVDDNFLKEVAERVTKNKKARERVYRLGSTLIKEITSRFEEGDELPISDFSNPKKIRRAVLKKEKGRIIVRALERR